MRIEPLEGPKCHKVLSPNPMGHPPNGISQLVKLTEREHRLPKTPPTASVTYLPTPLPKPTLPPVSNRRLHGARA